MSLELNRRAVLRTSPSVAPAKSGRPTPASAKGNPRTFVALDKARGIAFWSRPAGPLLVRRPRTDPHPKGKDPS
ncbi:hypothetical protein GCM10018780_86350 [Streptomyces lanatus]|nr:hypothetical protein GCM10018780_86350 [Streptomyces lanatus]